ncbi:zinc-ribbon domain-containing protein, partial [Selenomonas sp.]
MSQNATGGNRMARFCMNCGAKLEADDAFCPSC